MGEGQGVKRLLMDDGNKLKGELDEGFNYEGGGLIEVRICGGEGVKGMIGSGKGNDEVGFEVGIKALKGNLKRFAGVREWGWSREEEMEYGMKDGIGVSINDD